MDAGTLTGIPHELHGRSRDGADCYGIVWLAFREWFQIDLPSYADESEAASVSPEGRASLIEGNIGSDWVQIVPGTERPCDVALFRRGHIGIVVEKGRMLHSTSQQGASVIEPYDTFKWSRSLRAIYRHQALS